MTIQILFCRTNSDIKKNPLTSCTFNRVIEILHRKFCNSELCGQKEVSFPSVNVPAIKSFKNIKIEPLKNKV